MVSLLKLNETRGLKVEALIALDFVSVKHNPNPRGSYDLESSTCLYEVKSCCLTTKNSKKLSNIRQGRFLIHKYSHEDLERISKERLVEAKYIFVILDLNESILAKISLDWSTIDKLLSSHKPISRGDYQINLDKILGCET